MKQAKTNEKKRSPRFGVLDVVIILLVILSLAGIYVRYNNIDIIFSERNLASYAVSYSIENIRSTTTECMNVGDKLYFADDGSELGSFIEGSDNTGLFSLRAPTTQSFTKANGETVELRYPNENRIDVQGRFVCRGRYSDDGSFLVNGTRHIAKGQLISIHTEMVTVTLKIHGIEAVEAE